MKKGNEGERGERRTRKSDLEGETSETRRRWLTFVCFFPLFLFFSSSSPLVFPLQRLFSSSLSHLWVKALSPSFFSLFSLSFSPFFPLNLQSDQTFINPRKYKLGLGIPCLDWSKKKKRFSLRAHPPPGSPLAGSRARKWRSKPF